MEKTHVTNPSLGGDVSDFTGILLSVTKAGYQHTSLNPHGNPFEGKTLEEMVDVFADSHQKELDLLLNAVKNIFEGEERKPQQYKDSVRLIENKIKAVQK